MVRKGDVRYVQVAPCVPLGARGHDSYTYYISGDAECCIGQVVRIPFGKRTITGVVTKKNIAKPRYPTKEIAKISPIVLSDTQMQFASWISHIAHGGLGFTVRLFLPPSLSGQKLASENMLQPLTPRDLRPEIIIEKNTKKRIGILLKKVRASKGQTLILVPELAMLDAYAAADTVIYHAGLLQSEKKAIWNGVKNGEISNIVGTQKALFLPYQNLVCVIVDEEQYETHKLWDQYPRLHGVRAAMQLARIAGAQVVIASSYPSLLLRYGIVQGVYDVVSNNLVAIQAAITPFSFEDRKWKRPVPDDVGRKIRAWGRAGKTVVVLFNKKEATKVKETLHWKLSADARKRIHIGTSAILAQADMLGADHVVWLFPELTMRAIDYRAAERTRIIASRLQTLTLKKKIEVVTRYADIVRDVLSSSDDVWYAKAMKERAFLYLPPVADIVRLTIRDIHAKKALTRALKNREIIEANISDKKTQKVFGPYQEQGAAKKAVAEYFLLLAGPLQELVLLYKDLPIDSADVDPHRIV